MPKAGVSSKSTDSRAKPEVLAEVLQDLVIALHADLPGGPSPLRIALRDAMFKLGVNRQLTTSEAHAEVEDSDDAI